MTTWNPKIDCGVESSVEVYRSDVSCDECGKMGSYVLRDDKNSVGACRKHLEEEASTTKKTIIKVEQLPDNHSY